MSKRINITDLMILDITDYSLKKNKLIDYGYELIENKMFYDKEYNLYVNKKSKKIFIISAPLDKNLSEKLVNQNNSSIIDKINFFRELLVDIKSRKIKFNRFVENVKQYYSKNKYQYVYVGYSLGGYLVTDVFEKSDIVYLINPFLTFKDIYDDKFINNPNYTIFRTNHDIISSFTKLNKKLNIINIPIPMENGMTNDCLSEMHNIINFKNVFINLP